MLFRSITIVKLIKTFYNWVDENYLKYPGTISFEVKRRDSSYIGIDQKAHKQRMSELKSSNFFSSEFLTNYDEIARTIDIRLKTGSLIYRVGDMPPYGNDVVEWCDCQDWYEPFSESIKIYKMYINVDTADVFWSWKNNRFDPEMSYNIKLIRKFNQWKISYLQGFDIKRYFYQ